MDQTSKVDLIGELGRVDLVSKVDLRGELGRVDPTSQVVLVARWARSGWGSEAGTDGSESDERDWFLAELYIRYMHTSRFPRCADAVCLLRNE